MRFSQTFALIKNTNEDHHNFNTINNLPDRMQ